MVVISKSPFQRVLYKPICEIKICKSSRTRFSHSSHKPSKYHSYIIIMKSNKRGAPADKSGIATAPKRSSKRVKSVSTPSTPTSKRTSEKRVVPFGKTPADPLFVEIMDVNFNEDGLFILDFID